MSISLAFVGIRAHQSGLYKLDSKFIAGCLAARQFRRLAESRRGWCGAPPLSSRHFVWHPHQLNCIYRPFSSNSAISLLGAPVITIRLSWFQHSIPRKSLS